MKTHSAILCSVLLSCSIAIPLSAKEPEKKQELSGDDIQKLLINDPVPPYPAAYRARRLEKERARTGCTSAQKRAVWMP